MALSKDDSAKKMKSDHGLTLDPYPTVRSRQNLELWWDSTELKVNAAGVALAMTLYDKNIADMNEKQLLANGKFHSALVNSMADRAERKEFKALCGDEHMLSLTLWHHMGNAVEPDSIIEEDEKKAELDKAIRVKFGTDASPGVAKRLHAELTEKSDACKPDDQLDEKKMAESLVIACLRAHDEGH